MATLAAPFKLSNMTESFCEACNVINNILFSEIGRTKLAEEIAQWGVTGGEDYHQLRSLAFEYISHIVN